MIIVWLTLFVTQNALGSDHSIDLNRCKPITQDDGEYTDTVRSLFLVRQMMAQFRFASSGGLASSLKISLDMMHVMMQVKANPDEKLLYEDGLTLEQSDTRQFHCKPGSITGRPGFILNNVGAQIFSETTIFCSFTVFIANQIPAFVNSDTLRPPKLVVSIVKKETFSANSDLWLMMGPARCDHRLISSSNKGGPDTDDLLMEMDIFKESFTCSNEMLVEKADSTQMKALHVYCNMATLEWQMIVAGTKDPVPLPGKFSVYCIVRK